MGEEPLVEILSTERREAVRPKEVTIKTEVLEELHQRTQNTDNEFWVFILGRNGIGERYVQVGIGHRHGVLASPEQVVQALEPHLREGYGVVADYHNHPSEDIDEYTAAGFPKEYAASPSTGDLRQEVPTAIQRRLRQQPYPRIIALNIPNEQRVVLNAFNALKTPSIEEIDDVVFSKPGFTPPQEDENALVQIMGVKYGNPERMIEKGLFQPIKLSVMDKNGATNSITNPFSAQSSNTRQG